ncbi:MAG TPA: nitroreductase [Puia sp.]|nr:nitroreductase [Puia sp.]
MTSFENSGLDKEQVNALIRSRRSVFTNQFVPGREIPDVWIWQLLENARWAPSHKLTQPWQFTVFAGAGRQRLAIFQAELYKQKSGDKFKQDKYQKLLRTPLESSHVLAIGMKRSLTANIPEVEEVAAVACAVQNIYLGVTAFGLGGYWSTGGVTYYEEAKPFFGLEEQDKLLGFFYLGFVQIPSPKTSRIPISEKTRWVGE